MSKRAKSVSILLVAALTAISFTISGCSVSAEDVQLDEFFGAPVTLTFSTAHSAAKRDKLVRAINDRLGEIERSVSVSNVDSGIAEFNQNSGVKTVKIDKTAFDVLSLAKSFYELSIGAFDPTVAMLADLWGFSERHAALNYEKTYPYDRDKNADGSFDLPEDKYLSAFKSLADFSAVSFEQVNGEYYLSCNNSGAVVDGVNYPVKLDLAGVAKGYAADQAKMLIDQAEIGGVYISFGGSSLYLADNDGKPWGLGIVNPVKSAYRGTFARVEVINKFVATSGTYENCYTLDGALYHHVIDPATGAPTDSDLSSVTLIGDGGAKTDALATAMLIFGSRRALEFLDGSEFEYVLVTKRNTVYTNANSFSFTAEGFTLA